MKSFIAVSAGLAAAAVSSVLAAPTPDWAPSYGYQQQPSYYNSYQQIQQPSYSSYQQQPSSPSSSSSSWSSGNYNQKPPTYSPPPTKYGSCWNEGEMKCAGSGFITCNHGSYVYRQCGPGTACKSGPGYNAVFCDYASKNVFY